MDTTPKPGRKAKTPEAASGQPDLKLLDPTLFAKNMAEALQTTQRLIADILKQRTSGAGGGSISLDPFNLTGALAELASLMITKPQSLARAQLGLWQDYSTLWQNSVRRLLGEKVDPVIRPESGDRRFRHEDWQENQVFDLIKQSYLVTARWLQNTVAEVEGLDPQARKKIDFFTRQFVDAIAPTNFLLTNPEALRATLAENGGNLVRGLKNIAEDLERGQGNLSIKQSDLDAFEIGRNIALTPGKVVFKNDLMELIQYTPRTEQVHAVPLLFVPAWINKYYILDLNEEKSYVKWAVERGYTVFIISWVNPDAELSKKTFADYMKEGIYAALEAIEKQTGQREANAIGYCIGGTLLAATLAHMTAKNDKRIRSATFMASQVDFSEPGDLGVFIDEAQIDSLEKRMIAKGGYLPGGDMSLTFNSLRANDLIWSYVVNNYLLGRDPFPFDLLYWNSDQTRMPAAMHLFYLREMYQKNSFAKGELVLDGVKLDLSQVTTPVYIQSSKEDHIAPYPSVYKATKHFRGPIRFTIAGSGHIAGVINPPAAKKYQYWTNDAQTTTVEEWWKGAKETPGSWWVDWQAWLEPLSGDMVPARDPDKGKLKPLYDAPGEYVKVRGD